jgi:glycosyltransferase involved in cell wall biosynthesis
MRRRSSPETCRCASAAHRAGRKQLDRVTVKIGFVDSPVHPAMSPPVAVDIVIDNYNYARFLGAAIDSALAQRHPHARVIVVDDGSTDHSRDVITRYGDRITAVFKENGGQASAFNAGAARCRGDVVIFLDADDVLLPDAAARVAAAFVAAPRAVKVQYRMAVIDESGRRTGELKPARHVRMPTGDLCRSELTFPFDLPWMATSGNAFSVAALRRIMPIPEGEFATSADWYLQHLIPLLGDVVSLQDVGACYRVHGSNRYERRDAVLDVTYVRQSVRYAAATRRHLRRIAGDLGLSLPHGPILSVADLANRLISRKLEPAAHPLPADRVGRLAVGGAVAAVRRFDARWPKKLAFIVWFAAMALAPRRTARALAEVFLFPERRRRVNPLLGWLTKPVGRIGHRGES